ncbi:MAG TPA: hypothetical protein VFR41_01915 [Acidimicrobiia bacterium]|nr:hypothetical protein [Acidimicrobiia bacterium]
MTIEVGTAIVSYIEPAPGQARAFNEWYERDHFPAAVLAGPGVFAGARYVATRACKEVRPPSGTLFGDPTRGSYLAIAWVLAGKQSEWDAWVAREMETITAEGRLFEGREHLHTAVYTVSDHRGEIATGLERRFAGVIAVADYDRVHSVPGGLTVSLSLERTIVSSAAPLPHTLILSFVDDDPCALFAQVPTQNVGFASPFFATIPGTDIYTEEL